MVGERTVPLLPCPSIDEIADFYGCLGFVRTYRQQRPNPYVVLEREDIALHFFGMPDFDPAASYGSCLVVVPDLGALHAAFAAGMRERYGKVLIAGIPRMTRPRQRKNADGLTGFAVIDPGGNWIRFIAGPGDTPPSTNRQPTGKLAEALANAVVLGDSKGDTGQAIKMLTGAIRRHEVGAPAVDLVPALAYLAELSIRAGDAERASALAALARSIELSATERADLADELQALADLEPAN